MERLSVAAPVAFDSFGALLRARRRLVHLSQEELAARAGLSERTIRNLEANRVRVPRATTARLLAEALGLAGPEREVFVRACRGDLDRPGRVGLRALAGLAAAVPSGGDPPAQLPMDVHGFAGRENQLARLDAILAAAGELPTTVVVSAISGTAGVGKTALAVHWAHRVANRFGDGQLYVNLRGFDPTGATLSPATALGGFLDALGVPPQRIPTGLEDRAALYRSLLAGRRMLVLLDNARDAEHVRPLLPGTPGCLVVVTSRNQLTGLVAAEGAQPLTLGLLSDDEARQLLIRRLGAERVAGQEPQAVEEIITRCARLPLALAIVAAQAAIHPDFSLTVLAGQLRRTGQSLDAFAGDHPTADIRAVFSWSYHALSVEAARLFRLLGLHPGPDLSAPAAASLAGSATGTVHRYLAELTWAHLVTEHLPGRYTFHDLLRAYAVELAHSLESEPDRRAARRRLLDHYQDAAIRAALLLEPQRDRNLLPRPRQDLTEEDLTDRARSLAWFTAELPVLLAIIERGATGFDTHIWQLAWALTDFLPRRGLWQDWAATQRAALDAAQRLGDRAAQALAHRSFGRACAWLGRDDNASVHVRRAIELYGELDDRAGQAHSHLVLARVYVHQNRHDEACGEAQLALDLFRIVGDGSGQARALNAIGWQHAQHGRYDEALAYCRQALALLREVGDRSAQAPTLDSIGYALHYLGQLDEALACYDRAIDLYREAGDRNGEAHTLVHLADIHRLMGKADSARNAQRQALAILDELDQNAADQVRAGLHDLDPTE